MNGELLKLTDWFRANKLSLNISKTNYILFTYQNRQVVTNIDLQLSDISIERTKYTKFLGIYIDEKLKWDEHINVMKTKISKSFFAINKVKHILPRNMLTTLYYSLIYPYLTYGIILWGAASELFQEPTSGLTPKHYLKIFDSLNLRIYTSCMLTNMYSLLYTTFYHLH